MAFTRWTARTRSCPAERLLRPASDGSLHQHLLFALQDNDGNDATLPVDGLYLIAMRLKLPGLQDSLPVFMVFGTPGSSISAEDDAAVPWVEQQLNIPGDYNQNGVVDAADYVLCAKRSIRRPPRGQRSRRRTATAPLMPEISLSGDNALATPLRSSSTRVRCRFVPRFGGWYRAGTSERLAVHSRRRMPDRPRTTIGRIARIRRTIGRGFALFWR